MQNPKEYRENERKTHTPNNTQTTMKTMTGSINRTSLPILVLTALAATLLLVKATHADCPLGCEGKVPNQSTRDCPTRSADVKPCNSVSLDKCEDAESESDPAAFPKDCVGSQGECLNCPEFNKDCYFVVKCVKVQTGIAGEGEAVFECQGEDLYPVQKLSPAGPTECSNG